MMLRRRLLLTVIMSVLVIVGVAAIALGKAHVPANQVQVSHKLLEAINVGAPALNAHVGHGDIQLPACDFNNVFGAGADTSNVVSADFSGVAYSDKPFQPRNDAGGITPACPPGTF